MSSLLFLHYKTLGHPARLSPKGPSYRKFSQTSWMLPSLFTCSERAGLPLYCTFPFMCLARARLGGTQAQGMDLILHLSSTTTQATVPKGDYPPPMCGDFRHHVCRRLPTLLQMLTCFTLSTPIYILQGPRKAGPVSGKRHRPIKITI